MPEDPKSVLQRFYEELSSGNLDVIEELVADDFVEHEEFPGIEPNKEGVKQFYAMFRSAFPDLRMQSHEMLAEGDLVSARIIRTGTHQGEFIGISPRGSKIEVEAIDIFRIRDGELAEHWGVTDTITMMQQLGAFSERSSG